MERRPPDFARVFAQKNDAQTSETIALGETEVDAVIELAFLMANANGDASPDEIEAMRSLIKHLKPGASVGALLDALSDKLESAGSIPDRVRAAAKSLPRDLTRELAYKAVYAVAVYDLETNEEERDLEDLVIEALGIDAKRAHELGLETTHALLGRPA